MQDKIRLCFILSHLPQGGAERQTINIIKGLNPIKYEITLLLYANSEIFYPEVSALSIKIILNPASSSGKIVRNLKHAQFLRKALRSNKFDLLHTLLFHNGFWVRLLAPARYRGKILYSVRNSIEGISIFDGLAEKILVKRSIIVTNSRKVLQQYISLVGKRNQHRIHHIYNGIEFSRFASDRYPAINKTLIIGTVGRQTALKNQIQILRAIKDISKTEPVHFFLVGDRSKESSFANEEYVNKHNLNTVVTIMDSQTSIETYYRKFNVFVLSSINESCPNALLEAMLSKCLCIISDGANSDQFITDGINGLVYDGSLEMLKYKIYEAISLIKNNKHHTTVDNGFKYVMNNFSYDSMINAYDDIYNDMLKGSYY